MAEIDYQMALLLQHQFENELKASADEAYARKLQEQFQTGAPGTSKSGDEALARVLQEQFEQETNIDKPPPNLSYTKVNQKSGSSLIDPSWELVDPTPDIHNLFVAFNQKFFWGQLLSVSVSWSKRMTSCAGVCSYQYRGGMCVITLSEPLLKLRPRKDLVETLLHEMIHAFLFVTHNNKDRDGHGPEFHKHMYRINKESGTNITVYHTFHDEVRLYQQHWWRCNGPCQHRKPFFGMVKRAMNRAPGPNDRWWAEHRANCSGTFVKVREPEKKAKRKADKKSGDIQKFIPPISQSGFNSTSSGNIVGFKDLQNNAVKGRSNSVGTIVITGKGSIPKEITQVPSSSGNIVGFKDLDSIKAVRTEPPKRSNSVTDDFLNVRDHWANKFKTGDSTKKRPSPSKEEHEKVKVAKTECPVCNVAIAMNDLNSHLDQCLNWQNIEPVLKKCPICNKEVSEMEFDRHLEQCALKLCENETFCVDVTKADKENADETECLACGKKIVKTELKGHLELCMTGMFENEVEVEDDRKFHCPFCGVLVSEEEMKTHIDDCLIKDGLVSELMDDVF